MIFYLLAVSTFIFVPGDMIYAMEYVTDAQLNRKIAEPVSLAKQLIREVLNDAFAFGSQRNLIGIPPRFILYRKQRPNLGIVINEANIYKTNWDKRIPVTVLAHGYSPFYYTGADIASSNCLVLLKNEYFRRKHNHNLIIVDWRQMGSETIYPAAARNALKIGDEFGNFLANLYKSGPLLPNRTHVIGHSLGAQMAGRIGQTFHGITGNKLARITGLDPADPHFYMEGQSDLEYLDKSDGAFVDVIHSNGGHAGVLQPIGHLDFYLNDEIIEILFVVAKMAAEDICHHMHSFFIFKDSLDPSKQMVACKCDTWIRYMKGSCDCSKYGNQAHIGMPVSTRSKGVYFLQNTSGMNIQELIRLHTTNHITNTSKT